MPDDLSNIPEISNMIFVIVLYQVPLKNLYSFIEYIILICY